jgi:hypothetical protein
MAAMAAGPSYGLPTSVKFAMSFVIPVRVQACDDVFCTLVDCDFSSHDEEAEEEEDDDDDDDEEVARARRFHQQNTTNHVLCHTLCT